MAYLKVEHPSVGMIGDFGDRVSVRHFRVEGYDRARTTRPFLVSRDGLNVSVSVRRGYDRDYDKDRTHLIYGDLCRIRRKNLVHKQDYLRT